MKLPQSFLDLHAAGRFDYWGGKAYHDMDDAERARLLAERRTEVLWLRNIEWDVPLEEVAELDWTRPGLYGFAGNGGGDAYAFYPAWQADAAEPPVILVVHDEMVASVFAPTFALALYRLWLENGVYWDVRYDGDDRESALRAWAGILAPFLDGDHRAALEVLSVELLPAQLRAALDTFVASLPTAQLATNLPPTRYNPEYVKGETAKRVYAQSIAFFDALVEEGHERFRKQAEEARVNRDAALGGANAEPAKVAATAAAKPAPKAKPVKKASPKKRAPKKSAPKKAAPKKAAPKKAAPKKAAPKKAAPKKAAPKKAAPKKATPKKAAPKKAAPKKAAKAKPAPKAKLAPKAKPAKKSAAKKGAAKKGAAKKSAVKKAAPKKAAKKKATKTGAAKRPPRKRSL